MTFAFLGSLSAAVVFGAGAARLGFYSDDAGFLTTLPNDGLAATFKAAGAYVPGRNLHIIWQRLIYLVGGSSPSDLGTQHMIQSLLDGATVAVFYLLMRKLRIPRLWAVLATGAFAFYPNHGETHFWLSSGPMNVISTLFLLLFAYAASAAAERVRNTRDQAQGWLLASELLLFILALFTYDQVFFVLMFILVLRTAQTVLLRRRPTRVAMGFAGGYIGTIIWYAVLKQNPQSGPTLTHVSLSHVWTNVRLSVRETIGLIFRQQLDFLIQNPTRHEHLAAVGVALGFGVASLFLLVRTFRGFLALRSRRLTANSYDEVAGINVLRAGALVAAGILTYFLAYLPADLWYISPRHNFLPTAGFALALGAAGATLSSLARVCIHDLAPLLLGAGAVVAGGLLLVAFVEAGLSEKRYWQETYQLRRNLYGQMVHRRLLAGKTAIVFEGFPAALGPAPYFEQENQLALNYLYPTRASLKMSAISTLESSAGYYLYTEVNRYGPSSVRFVPRDKVLRVTYLSQTESTVRFSTTRRADSTSRFYTVVRLPRTGGLPPPTFAVRGARLVASAVRTRLILDVDLKPGTIAKISELAVFLKDSRGMPWTTPNRYDEPMLIPIRLTDRAAARSRMRFVVTLRAPIPPNMRYLTLYSLGEDMPRALATATASSR